MDDLTPLVATNDDALLDDALRWCAAVGRTPEVVADVSAARRSWRTAPAVVVGDDLATDLARARLPRRDHVLLLTRECDAVWPVAVALGAVAVVTTADEARALDALTLALDGRGEACLVSVVGGVGGAGASTLASAVALRGAHRGLRSLLVDADPLGGGLDLVLGTESVDGVRWNDLAGGPGDREVPIGPLAAGSLTDVLPRRDGLAALSWGREGAAEMPDSWPQVISAAVRGFDLVVADVPRHLDGVGTEIIGGSVLTVVVVPEEVRAVASARRVLDRLEAHTASVAVVSAVRPGGLGGAAVSDALARPVIARLRHDRHLRAVLDHGLGPGRSRSMRRAGRAVLDLLGLQPSGGPARSPRSSAAVAPVTSS